MSARTSGKRGASLLATEEIGIVAGLTHDGEGVVREGKTVFVPGALAGERIRFRRTKRHRQHDDGQLLEVLEPSARRVQPLCQHFGVCGGCALQHFAPEAQLESKQAELRDSLERVSRVTPEQWLQPLRSHEWSYRRRARLGAKYVPKKGRVLVGFRERLSPYVTATARCEVLAAPAGQLLEPLASLLMTLGIRERVPQIELSVADNGVALVLRVLSPPSPDDLERLRTFEAAHGVRFYLQPGGLETVHRLPAGHGAEEGAASLVRPGEEPLRYGLPEFDVDLEFSPTDFIQVNGPANRALVSRAFELLDPGPDARVLDLFCGLGNFTLPLARRAGSVVGVEGEPVLIDRARHNARLNRIDNAEFHVADLAKPISPEAPWLKSGYTHVLLDPPRVGAREVLRTVAQVGARRVLYISCHPGSLARDLGILVHDHGFLLRAAGVVDMFPHTTHVESLAVLEPAEAKR